ncbi:hypothetical protein AGR1C_Lc10050 [Agrobacterium fabacearum TT111]|nr:hypothetical protein AGR1C_Lc10050 [Agrobacterium fabacearum TT111]
MRRPQRHLPAQRPGIMSRRRRCRATVPYPLSPTRTRHQRIFPPSPIAPGATSQRPVPPTPARPTPPTGSIFQHGAGGRALLPSPHPQTVGLYITACASGAGERGMGASSVSTIERRLSSLSWNFSQRGLSLDRKDRHIATVMAGVRNSHARPPVQKEAGHGRGYHRHDRDA